MIRTSAGRDHARVGTYHETMHVTPRRKFPRRSAVVAALHWIACTPLIGSTEDARVDGADAVSIPDVAPVDCPREAGSQPGTPDPTRFGEIDFKSFAGALGGAQGTVMDTAGRTYVFGGVVGCAAGRTDQDGFVTRLTPDAEFDRSFGIDGRMCIGLRAGSLEMDEIFYGLTFDSESRIVLVGNAYDRTTRVRSGLVARLLSDGQPDPTFGSAGVRRYPVLLGGTPSDAVFFDAVAEPGRIVVSGADANEFGAGTVGYALALHSDGAPDETFAGGEPWVDLGGAGFFALARVDDGYVFAGHSRVGSRARLARLHNDGTLVDGFGDHGIASHSEAIATRIRGLVTDRRGGFVVGGARTDDPARRESLTLLRFDQHGGSDLAFGSAGRAVAELQWETAYQLRHGLVADCEGRLITVGRRLPYDVGMVRFSPDGQFDTSFGEMGMATIASTVSSPHYIGAPRVSIDARDGQITVTTGRTSGGFLGLWRFRN